MIEFCAVKESLYSEDIGSFIAYGIDVCVNDRSERKKLGYVPNVFLSQEKAEHFADLCNRLQLDPLHLLDVVADAILDI